VGVYSVGVVLCRKRPCHELILPPRVLPTVYRIQTEKAAKAQQKGGKAIDNNMLEMTFL
jgi:hypothetical protein